MMKEINTGIRQEDKEKIIRIIDALFPGSKIFLYGSRARGTYHHASDIDIAIDAHHKLERVLIGEVKDMLNASNIVHKIDVVDFHNIPAEMRNDIIKEGTVWKE